jgi:hypothetical protein
MKDDNIYLIRSCCEKVNEIDSGKSSLYYLGKSTVEMKIYKL